MLARWGRPVMVGENEISVKEDGQFGNTYALEDEVEIYWRKLKEVSQSKAGVQFSIC